ncbi:MAG: NADH:ubiquinone reductase (Na(+)-transporting) subunit F [Flavobacteriales bacterium AspAUS03]
MTVVTIFTTVISFLILMIFMVALLLTVKAKLSPSGPVKITVNGGKTLEVASGSSLLSTLSNQKLFLPSACGGGGTCLQCKCQVFSGGGDILPTEEPHFTRRQKEQHWRLGCQVKVRQDMQIQISEEVFGIKKWECTVQSNYNVASFIKEFVVQLPKGEKLDFKAGGYIQIDVPSSTIDYKNIDITAHPKHHDQPDKFRLEWDKFKLWDLKMINEESIVRAYSIANHPADGNIIMLNIRVTTPPFDKLVGGWAKVNPGICSSYVFSKKPGDKVTISGPYGEFFINEDSQAEMIYVGGGAGMAPMRSHLFHLFHTKKTQRKVSFWYGGRSKRELFYLEDFRAIEHEFPNFKFYIILSEPLPEDNWKSKKSIHDPTGDGFTGFAHQALIDHYLKDHEVPEDVEFYFCGPPMMNNAVVKMCDDFGVPKGNIRFDDFGG